MRAGKPEILPNLLLFGKWSFPSRHISRRQLHNMHEIAYSAQVSFNVTAGGLEQRAVN
jgi:hypothetical protein